MRAGRGLLFSIAGFLALASAGRAQWSFSSLNPPGATGSTLYGGYNNQQVGYVSTSNTSHAGYWSGTAGSFVDLDPSSAAFPAFSLARATNGTQQGGYKAAASFAEHATLWSGTAGSAVDLHPASGYARSFVNAMTDTMQGGYADVTVGTSHAMIWSGTAESFVDLNPSGYIGSYVMAMAGSQQAGYGRLSDGSSRALLWNGSAGGFVYLHASGPTSLTASAVYAMTATQQGGTINLSGGTSSERAAMWSGTADSRVDLHPSGATNSRVLAMAGSYQAGQVNDQAAVWQGSAGSWVNLHALIVAQLGSNYTKSAVTGAYVNGSSIYLVGYTQDTVNGVVIAMMWTNSNATIAPAIVTQPQSQAANAGASATFTASATGTAPLTYQWRKGGANFGGASSSATLTLNSLADSDAGSYDVVISNAGGSATSAAAILTINPVPLSGLRNVISPGESLNLSIAATGTGTLTFQWFHDFVAVPGATGNSLLLSNVTYQATGHYELQITDDNGSRRSAPIFVTVAPATTQIIAWGDNGYGQTNVPADLNDAIAVAAGYSFALALRRDGTVVGWGRNNAGQATPPAGLSNVVAIAAGDTHAMALKADGAVVQWGNYGPVIAPIPAGLAGVVAIATGDIFSVALKSDGTVATWGSTFGSWQNGKPTTPSGIRGIAAGNSLTLALKMDGTVQAWGASFSGSTFVPAGLSGVVALDGGYDYAMAVKSDGAVVGWGENAVGQSTVPSGLGNLVAVAAGYRYSFGLRADGTLTGWGSPDSFPPLRNIPATATGVFALATGNSYADAAFALCNGTSFTPPVITAQPVSLTVTGGDPFAFSVTATSEALLHYQWKRDGTPVAGATQSSYSKSSALLSDAGAYMVDVFNVAGSVTSNVASLAVNGALPVITTHPQDRTILENQVATFGVTATGAPAPAYLWQWKYPGGPWQNLSNGAAYSGVTSATLNIDSANRSGSILPQTGDQYRCYVYSALGSVTSNAANLTLLAPLPSITTQPVSQDIGTGAPVTFTVVASSTTALSYQWRKGGNPIANATQASYTIASTQLTDAGDYTVVVSNSGGPVTSAAATLTVHLAAPVITQQPVNQTTAPGGMVSFGVQAVGLPAPSYQWQISRAVFPPWINTGDGSGGVGYTGSQTDTLTITGTVGDNGDQYRCVASNLHGSATSNAATLSVLVGGFPKFSAGRYHSLRLDAGARLNVSGTNTFGQLGTGNTTNTTTPQVVAISGQTIVDLVAGAEHSLFLTADRELWATGKNTTGQLGDSTLVAKSTPIKIATNVAGLAAGNFHSAFLKSDGTLWTVGGNDSGQLGDGTTTDRSTPQQVATYVVDVVAGIRQTLFMKSDGTLWGMGDMNGSGVPVSTPMQIATGVRGMAAGGYHSLILKTDGTLWTMGYNPYGQLGNGNTMDTSTPAQIATGVKAVAAGYFHSAFIKTDNSLWVMGYNSGGQLGDGTTTARATPFQLAANVALASASEAYTLFSKIDGTVWGTGYNAYGQFGNGTTTTTTIPVQITAGTVLTPLNPTGLAVSVGTPADRLHLTWSPARNATRYEVWRHTANDSSGATRLASDVRWSVYQDLTAVNGTVYYYWLKSVNASGTSLFSAPVVASFTPLVAPSISAHPASQTVNVGANVTFSVTASGTAPFTYLWRKGGVAIGGATGSDYSITGVTLTDAGSYDVVVTNSAGTATSDPAILTVNKLGQTITFAALADRAYTTLPFSLSATSSSGLTVGFAVQSGPATVSGTSLTLTGAGIITVRASQSGNSNFNAAPDVDQSFTVSANFASWALSKFTTDEWLDANLSGPNALFGQDGLPNLVKYALGFEPKQNITTGLPWVGTLGSDWTYTYTRPDSITDVTYAVEVSTNLTTWTTAGVTHELVSNSGGIDTWRGRYPLASASNCYFRLKVSR